MNIARIDFAKPTVVVLGAGATRGALLASKSATSKSSRLLPPLDSDFFTQAQRLSGKKPNQLVEGLIRDTVEIFGTNFKLTMEGFLTQVEHLSSIFEDYKLQGRPPGNRYPVIRAQFLQVLAAVLYQAIGRQPECDYHKRLVENMSTADTILSFNYDWLIDYTLKIHGLGKWNPLKGYGVKVYKKHGAEYWAYRNPLGQREYPSGSISLLKMHGAMNWFPVARDQNSPRLRLRQKTWHQNGSLNFEIVPPEWNKPPSSARYNRLIYQSIWRQARRKVKNAKALAFIGYSLPPTDLPAQALFMVDAKTAPPLELLVVANPDQETRKRIRQVLQRRINQNTRVLSFDLFKDFSDFLQSD